MTSRLLVIRKGKTGDTQQFPKVKDRSRPTETLLLDTLKGSVNNQLRTQLLFDYNLLVTQVAVVFDRAVGLFTRPFIVEHPNDDPVEVGVFPIPLDRCTLSPFLSKLIWDTLLPWFGLETLRLPPITSSQRTQQVLILCPPIAQALRNAPEPEAPTLGRLNFPMEEGAREADWPMIGLL